MRDKFGTSWTHNVLLHNEDEKDTNRAERVFSLEWKTYAVCAKLRPNEKEN